MQITKFGHSCLLVTDGDAKILIDPGTFSAGFEPLTDLTAILITHQHADHLDLDRLPAVVAANPDAAIHADPGSVSPLETPVSRDHRRNSGDDFDVGTGRRRCSATTHAQIHPTFRSFRTPAI